MSYEKGVVLMIGSAASLALAMLMVDLASVHISLIELLFLRFALPAVLLGWVVFVLLGIKGACQVTRTDWLRALCTVLSQGCLFYYLQHGSLLLATLLFTTSPLFIPVLQWLIWRVRLQLGLVLSLLLGFVGVACVIQPWGADVHWVALVGLMAGAFNAGSHIANHHAVKARHALVVTWMMYSLSSLLLLVPLAFSWHDVSIAPLVSPHAAWIWMSLLGFTVFSISNQSLRSRAYQCVKKASSLSPFIYLALVFSALLGWLAFDEVPDWATIVGMVLVVCSAVMVVKTGVEK